MARSLRSLLLATLGLWLVQTASAARFQAMFADGTRVEGNTFTNWHADGAQPKVDETRIWDPARPLRWFTDSSPGAPPTSPESGPLVELVGGDCLPGRLARCQPRELERGAGSGEWVAVVESPIGSGSPFGLQSRIRVDCGAVRRIVWHGDSRRRLEPGTLLYSDGRQVSFRHFRWGSDSLELLTDDGLRQVALADLAEVHLPCRDPWDHYYQELARLMPDGTGRLVRFQTTEGLLVTVSSNWWRPSGVGQAQNSMSWWHIVQPAWSLDPLYVNFALLRAIWSFAPHEVPLSRIEPSRTVQRVLLTQGSQWQANRNVRGGPLGNASRDYAWGFGVQAANELWFDLPDAVQAFRTQVGLDRIAGNGGCARGVICCNLPTDPPLYRSPHLIGSTDAADSGTLSLRGPSAGQKSLILVADPAAGDRPAGADPLDIRDTLDWLEPMLLLDPAKLKAEIEKRVGCLVPAWQGWQANVEGGPPPRPRIEWDESDPVNRRFVITVSSGQRPLTLSLDHPLTERDGTLEVQLRSLARNIPLGRLEVRAGGRPVARIEVPPGADPPRYSLPLEKYRREKAKLELVYLPADERDRVHWQMLATTRTRWVPLTQVQVRSLQGAALAQQSDGSILVARPAATPDVHVLTARTELPWITGLRLETLPDPSLPGGGPGTWRRGEFLLSEFQAAQAKPSSPDEKTSIPLADAVGDEANSYQPATQAIKAAAHDAWSGWFIRAGYNEPHAVIFPLRQPVEMKDRLLIVSLVYRCPMQPAVVGRFRILATSDGPPVPTGDIPLPLLPEAAQ